MAQALVPTALSARPHASLPWAQQAAPGRHNTSAPSRSERTSHTGMQVRCGLGSPCCGTAAPRYRGRGCLSRAKRVHCAFVHSTYDITGAQPRQEKNGGTSAAVARPMRVPRSLHHKREAPAPHPTRWLPACTRQTDRVPAASTHPLAPIRKDRPTCCAGAPRNGQTRGRDCPSRRTPAAAPDPPGTWVQGASERGA